MWNTVLFDLDGTLTDSGEGITKSVQYALEKEFGMQVPLSDLRCFVGPPLKEQFMSFAGVSEEAAVRAVERYRERYRPKGIYENYLYDGIKTMLRQLHEEHFTLALTSSKPTMFCRQILRMFNIDEYFTAVVGSDMDGRRTDKYELIEETIRELGMQDLRDEIVMVGDRKYDCVGAASAGIDCTGVTYGFGSRQELEEEWPACIVDSPIELRNVLIGQARSGAEGPGGSSAWGEKSTEMAGRAIKAALEQVKMTGANTDVKSQGRVVIGTVKGDLHDIGKNLVASMLEGCGFEVVNAGIDVSAEKFVEAIQKHHPDLLCMSALLTTTMGYMREVIDTLKRAGLRQQVKVMVGGAPVTQHFADEIGADGYSDNANSAVALAKELMGAGKSTTE